MRKSFPILLLVLLASSPAFGFQNDWIKFEPPAENFSILMPIQPKENVSKADTAGVGPSSATSYLAREGTQLYLLGFVDYATFVFNNQKELEANRDNFMKPVNATLDESRNLTWKTFPSIEFKAHSPEYSFIGRILIVGKRPYMLVVAYPINEAVPANTEKFFSSFNVRPRGSKGL